MTSSANELPVPEAAGADSESREMLRAWVANAGLHCSLNIGAWGEDEAIVWGILLSDVARHVANALEEGRGVPQNETINRIREHFNLELDSPTDEPRGRFV